MPNTDSQSAALAALKLSDEKIAEYRASFNLFDLDGNGMIDFDELREMLRRMGKPCCEASVRDCINKLDDNKNGYIDFYEFCMFMETVKPPSKEQELRTLFDECDTNGDHNIDISELDRLMKRVGYTNLKPSDLQDMMSVIDTDGNGVIDFNEFLAFMTDIM